MHTTTTQLNFITIQNFISTMTTQEKKQKMKEIFLECWNNPDIDSKDLHNEIKIRLVDAELVDPGINLTEQSVRASFGNIDEKYTNYRTRPRTKEGIVFDFSEPKVENESKVQVPVQEEISRPDPVTFD